MANEIEKRNEAFLIYQDENGITRVNVRFEGEDVWLSIEQIMELFDASQQDISYHIKQIYTDGEQDAKRTHKKFLLVRQEGSRSVRRNMSHYNLDMIIAVGYRVKSQVATRFRQWATQHLREFIQKGFTLDDDRLKDRPRHVSWLRIYAIKLEPGCYIITGGAIKLTRTMQEREHTLAELGKMEQVRNFLISNQAIDADGFVDFLSELQ